MNNLLPVDVATGDVIKMLRTSPNHFTTNGQLGGAGAEKKASFEDAMLKALDGVNASQQESSSLVEAMLVDPESVDAHEVTIAMSEASMTLNIARTVLDRVVRAWKEVLNTR